MTNDIRFGYGIWQLNAVANKEFPVFNTAELVVGIVSRQETTQKETDALIEWVKRPQVGARNGLCEMQRRWNLQIIG
jgi:aspartyl-tRNA synthetase